MYQAILYNNTFDKNINDVGTSIFLEDVAKQYPYFGVCHFFNLKTANPNQSNYEALAQKAILFFNNPYVLQKNLNELDLNEIDKDNIGTTIIDNPIVEAKEIIYEKPKVVDYPKNINECTITTNLDNNEDKKMVTNEPLFEPLHATDYFASQGIKYSQLPFTNDKLGNQLKSFTSWLKTMKKVHPDKLAIVNIQAENAIQNQAAKSNVDTEVVTESMAEAYILQNKNIKAVEVYQKLSLLDTTKSAYFAAKIEFLKK